MTDSLKQVFSPRDPALFPITVGEVRVAPGAQVAPDTVLMTLRTSDGKTLAMRSPVPGRVVLIAAGPGDVLASPRPLVSIAETLPADDAPPGAPAGDSPAEAEAAVPPAKPLAEDAPSATGPQAPPSGSTSTNAGRIAMIAAAALVVAVAVFAVLPGAEEPPRTAAPPTLSASPASPPASSAVPQPAETLPRAADAPPVQTGPLSRDVMLARSLDGRATGRAATGRIPGQGLLAVQRHGSFVQCPAILVSDRHAITTRLCLDVRSTSDVTEEDSTITFRSARPYAEGSIDSRSYFHFWQTGVTAVHVWHGEVEGGSPVSLALVELAEAAPKALGRSGHWSMTSASAPPLLDLRSYSATQPLPGNAETVACRYWLHERATPEVSQNGMPLTVDPNCPDARPLVDGPFMARHADGTSYFAGFYSREGRYKTESIVALALSRGDEAVIASARNGTLLPGSVRLFPTQAQPPRPSHQVLVSNPCDTPTRFVAISAGKKRNTETRVIYEVDANTASSLVLNLKPDDDTLFLSETTMRPAQGLVRHDFEGEVYYGLDFDVTSPLQMLLVTECRAG